MDIVICKHETQTQICENGEFIFGRNDTKECSPMNERSYANKRGMNVNSGISYETTYMSAVYSQMPLYHSPLYHNIAYNYSVTKMRMVSYVVFIVF